jgi:hypothetical protein
MSATMQMPEQDLGTEQSAAVERAVLDIDDRDLKPGDIDLIVALLLSHTKRDAARMADVSEATLYRRLQDPAFQQALRVSRDQYRRRIVDRMADAYCADPITRLMHRLLEPAA